MAHFDVDISISKDEALKLVKKAISGKFAIMSDKGYTLKVGAPMMTATIEVTDTQVKFSGSPTVATTCHSEFKSLLDDYGSGSSNSSGNGGAVQALSIDDQLKIAEAIKKFKELLDSGIITQEDFDAKKTELLQAGSFAKPNTPATKEANSSTTNNAINAGESLGQNNEQTTVAASGNCSNVKLLRFLSIFILIINVITFIFSVLPQHFTDGGRTTYYPSMIETTDIPLLVIFAVLNMICLILSVLGIILFKKNKKILTFFPLITACLSIFSSIFTCFILFNWETRTSEVSLAGFSIASLVLGFFAVIYFILMLLKQKKAK